MSAHQQTTSQKARLRRRASYFFASTARGRTEVAEFAALLGKMGDVAVVGGMLRDLHLEGNRTFKSDVDFVAGPGDIGEFDRTLAKLGAKLNRFGGYAVTLSRWKVEVWPVERTWAARHGHATVNRVEDILRTTFFDWDAVLFKPLERRVVAGDGYFEKTRCRVLDINLLPNPNPQGNAIRALRYAWRWNATMSPRLAEHVQREIHDTGWKEMVDAEAASFHSRVLLHLDPRSVKNHLAALTVGASSDAVPHLRPMQSCFTFIPVGSSDASVTQAKPETTTRRSKRWREAVCPAASQLLA